MAHAVRESATHYKDFKVGCVGWSQGKVFFGANHKPAKNAEPKCAEEEVMEQAEKLGIILDGMVIVGQPREEDVAMGLLTLHCCGERCRPSMRRRIKEGTSVRPNTQLICINALDGKEEPFTIQTLHDFHGESLDD